MDAVDRLPKRTRLALRAVEKAVRAQNSLYRPLHIAQRVVGSALMTALSPDEKEALGLMLYDHGRHYRGHGLHAWEQLWFKSDLPKAPARLLVGASGAGREAVGLIELGHTVTCFDGSPSMVRECQARMGDKGHAFVASFTGFADDIAAGRRPAGLDEAPYDAALIGWGSIGHVYDDDVLVRLLRALDRVCPTGPLLLSFPEPRQETYDISPGKAERLGRGIGRAVCNVRGRDPTVHRYEYFAVAEGFLRSFPREAVDGWAASIGRKAVHANYGYPTVTLQKR